MTIKIKKYITREFMRQHPDWIFVFGDNSMRVGKGGQAKEMRGEPNALGVRTKEKPLFSEDAYWTDKGNYSNRMTRTERNCELIWEDLLKVLYLLRENKTVVFPKDGIGTGMAELETRAPRTYKYLQDRINELFKEYGPVEEIE